MPVNFPVPPMGEMQIGGVVLDQVPRSDSVIQEWLGIANRSINRMFPDAAGYVPCIHYEGESPILRCTTTGQGEHLGHLFLYNIDLVGQTDDTIQVSTKIAPAWLGMGSDEWPPVYELLQTVMLGLVRQNFPLAARGFLDITEFRFEPEDTDKLFARWPVQVFPRLGGPDLARQEMEDPFEPGARIMRRLRRRGAPGRA